MHVPILAPCVRVPIAHVTRLPSNGHPASRFPHRITLTPESRSAAGEIEEPEHIAECDVDVVVIGGCLPCLAGDEAAQIALGTWGTATLYTKE